jgi:hypothetical protein
MKRLTPRNYISILSTYLLLFSAYAQGADNQDFWQLTFTYSETELRITEAAPVLGTRKQLSNPGAAGAPIKVSYTVDWLDSQGASIFTTDMIAPLGQRAINAQDGPCKIHIPESDLFVVRIPGPNSTLSPAAIRLTKASQLNGATSTQALPPIFIPNQQVIPLERIIDFESQALGVPEGPLGAVKIRDAGPDDNRLVIAVAGDGYTAANLANGDFSADAAALVSAFTTKSPWNELFAGANVYRIDIESNEEGADQAGNVGGSPPGTFVDTYLHSSYWTSDIERLLTISSGGRNRVTSAANVHIGFGVWDHIFVLVNHTKYGGSGGSISVSSVHSAASEIIMHEFGHTFASSRFG